jgi:hypothetical protein
VTWKRNGGEHAWSLLRISRVSDICSTERRCPGCIGREHTAAKLAGRSKKASTDTRLSDVGISYDQFSRWQKLAAVPEEILEREVQDENHIPTRAGVIRAGVYGGRHLGGTEPDLQALRAMHSERGRSAAPLTGHGGIIAYRLGRSSTRRQSCSRRGQPGRRQSIAT